MQMLRSYGVPRASIRQSRRKLYIPPSFLLWKLSPYQKFLFIFISFDFFSRNFLDSMNSHLHTKKSPVLHYQYKTFNTVNLQQTGTNAVPTICYQDVFAMLVPSLLTICHMVVARDLAYLPLSNFQSCLVTRCIKNLLASSNSITC